MTNKKKKLLILGGMNFSCEIVRAAHQLNYYVCVADYYLDSPAKSIADQSFLISATDVDAIVTLIGQESIDGVIFGYADVLMSSYIEICSRTGLPCYLSYDVARLSLDKSYFKNTCQKYNIPSIPEFTISDVENNIVDYPVLIKPVDNSGARGIYICQDKARAVQAYKDALAMSPSKKVLIEKYINADEATAFYYLHNGVVYLLGIADRHMLCYDEECLPLPIGYMFPSVHTDSFLRVTHPKIAQMFRQEGLSEGCLFMQGFFINGEFVPYEMGHRLTASLEQYAYESLYNFNPMHSLLKFAVGDEITADSLARITSTAEFAANISVLLGKGTITTYEGVEEIRCLKQVRTVFLSYPIGTCISDAQYGKLSQIGIRIILVSNDKKTLISDMDKILARLHVLDQNGEDMVVRKQTYSNLL